MTGRDFCFWLQGYLELENADRTAPAPLTSAQVDCVRRHLALVFIHEIDPKLKNINAKMDDLMQKIHDAAVETKPFCKPAPPYSLDAQQGSHGPLMRC